MKRILVVGVLPILGFFLFSCSSKTAVKEEKDLVSINESPNLSLTVDQAAHILSLPIHCLEVAYPNKLGQVIGSSNDLKTPKELRPIFYGCFDWHSSVHGYWSVIELLQKYPNLDTTGTVRALLNKHITPENVAVELSFFKDPLNSSFERTYGWAWLFKLQESLDKWEDQDAKQWKENLQPLVDTLVSKYLVYLPKLLYPIRTGQHDNAAFGLSLSLDYARRVGNKTFETAIIEQSKRLYMDDKNCDLAYEPSGYDFLSPCFEEAYLMSKVLQVTEYEAWLKTFMPNVFDKTFMLNPALVKDRSDGKLIHLDGLNYSRAACLYGIAKVLPELAHLNRIADEHITFSLPNLSAQDDYMGSHWLGTFALYALQKRN